ncbi:hypothetical protein [Pseudoduganella sp. OTU4001]|uniref:hypothetical protein n=1 Tax=Pseudoduganella sp. OTU4001 TaxID=3043854 RepID=UPI00313E2EAC
MKTWAAGGALIALLFSASALAEDNLSSVRVSAPGSYKMPRAEFREYSYRYELSNDMHIRFSQSRQRYYAELDGEPAIELIPVSPGVLVTTTGSRVEFSAMGAALTIYNFERLSPKLAALGKDLTLVAAR